MEGFIMPGVAVLCCVLALGFKAAFPTWERAHDFIPLGCALLGIALVCGFQGWTLDNITAGAVSGFAATGLWEQLTHAMPPIVGSHVEGD